MSYQFIELEKENKCKDKSNNKLRIKKFDPNLPKPAAIDPPWKQKGNYIKFNFDLNEGNKKEKKIKKSKKGHALIKHCYQTCNSLTEYTKISNFETYNNWIIQIPSNVSFNLNNLRPLPLYQSIFGNPDIISLKERLLIKNDGSFEYFGSNPCGYLVIAYFSLKIKPIRRHKFIFDSKINKKENYPRIIKESDLVHSWFENLAIQAYFEYFHYFFPVVDKRRFYTRPSLLLKRLVISIGYNYISNNDPQNEVFKSLDKALLKVLNENFFKPSIDLVTVLTLISNFLTLRSQTSQNWMFLNSSIGLSKMLGLDKRAPKKLGLSQSQVIHRCHQWWACCIQDKAFAITLNRPMSISPSEWRLPCPDLSIDKKIPEHPTLYYVEYVKHLSSLINFRANAMLSEVSGVIRLTLCPINKFSSNDLKAKLESILNSLTRSKEFYYKKLMKIYSERPKWVYNICETFLLDHTIRHNNVVIEAINAYQRISSPTDGALYEKKCLEAAASLILAAEKLGSTFIKYGRLFRFICLGSAALVFTRKLCNNINDSNLINSNQNDNIDAFSMLQKAYTIFLEANQYYPVVNNIIKVIDTLIHPSKSRK